MSSLETEEFFLSDKHLAHMVQYGICNIKEAKK